MKKIIFALTAVLIIFATGCEKINDNDVINRNDTNAKTLVGGGWWGLHREWVPALRTCLINAVDCFDPIIITHGCNAIFDKIGPTPNPQNIPSEITDNVKPEFLAAALKQELIITAVYNETAKNLFLIFSDSKTEKTVVVYQFTNNE